MSPVCAATSVPGPDLFEFCVHKVHYSEQSAFKRIRVARLARQFPAIYDLLAEGKLHLSALVTLSAHLTPENAGDLLAASVHRTKAQLEQMLAERFPQPDLPAMIAALTPTTYACQLSPGRVKFSPAEHDTPAPPAPMAPPPPLAKVAPLAPQRFAVQCTVSQETYEKLERAQERLGHSVPNGDLAQVLDRALDLLIAQLERRKFARTDQPRPCKRSDDPRHIPASVKRGVWERDGRGSVAPQRTCAGRSGGRRPTGRQVPRRQAATGRRREPDQRFAPVPRVGAMPPRPQSRRRRARLRARLHARETRDES